MVMLLYVLLAFVVSCWIGSLASMRFWMPFCCDPRHMYKQAFFVVLASPLVVTYIAWECLCIALTYGNQSCEEMRELARQPDDEPLAQEELAQEVDMPPPF